jgi:endonuclease/exonuclease/phosphatase family metal-dependent hydrolase
MTNTIIHNLYIFGRYKLCHLSSSRNPFLDDTIDMEKALTTIITTGTVNTPISSPLTILTWNVEYMQQYDELLSLLTSFNADILLLQEVPTNHRKSNKINAHLSLASDLKMNSAFSPEFEDKLPQFKGVIGNMILSKFPLNNVQRIGLPEVFDWNNCKAHPRVGQRNAIIAQSAGVTLCSTHLEVFAFPWERKQQLKSILPHMKSPGIIGGDFNTVIPGECPEKILMNNGYSKHHTGQKTTHYSFIRPLDQIVTKKINVLSYDVIQTPFSTSDHLPVICKIDKPS